MEAWDPQIFIIVIVLMTGLGFIFNILLKPVKDNQVRFEKRLDSFDKKLSSFEKRLDSFERRLGSLDSKLDQLLARK